MIKIINYSPEYEVDVLMLIAMSHDTYELTKNKQFKPEVHLKRLRLLDLQQSKKTAHIKLATLNDKVVGVLMLSKLTHIFDDEDSVWLEQLWYPDMKLPSNTRVKIMLSLLDDFLLSTDEPIIFTLPSDAIALSKLLNKRGFKKTETHFRREG